MFFDNGEVPEWSIGCDWKSHARLFVPQVRILFSPQCSLNDKSCSNVGYKRQNHMILFIISDIIKIWGLSPNALLMR